MLTCAGRPVVDIGDHELNTVEVAAGVPQFRWSQAAEEARRAVGAAGEQALLRILRQGGVPQVRHVAARSDAYGYDIEAARSRTECAHVEVKATTDPTRLVIHLSRHEYDVMVRDAEWCLAAVLVGVDGSAVNVATVCRRWLHSAVPADRAESGRWESARLEVPAYAIVPGLSTDTWRLVPDELLPIQSVWASRSPAPQPA
ncbi:protein NO VEIN domain-containing protein [Streptomyces sp. NPDC056796]|uniref:protein NO VEIN domain-containing protein n=1 Tax=unclassified Streptomyces TaxID=2593676 RepID=UPI00368C82F0